MATIDQNLVGANVSSSVLTKASSAVIVLKSRSEIALALGGFLYAFNFANLLSPEIVFADVCDPENICKDVISILLNSKPSKITSEWAMRPEH